MTACLRVLSHARLPAPGTELRAVRVDDGNLPDGGDLRFNLHMTACLRVLSHARLPAPGTELRAVRVDDGSLPNAVGSIWTCHALMRAERALLHSRTSINLFYTAHHCKQTIMSTAAGQCLAIKSWWLQLNDLF